MVGILPLVRPHTSLGDAIKYSDQYYGLMKGNDALFNMACAYAQAYCRGVELEPSLSKSQENSRERALSYLEEALKGRAYRGRAHGRRRAGSTRPLHRR